MDKRTTEAEVVAELRDGMTVGIGGWGSRRKPMSLVRAILRSPLRDLTVVSYGGPDVGLRCATGKLRKLIYGFVSLDSIPLEPHFRRVRQGGGIEAREVDEGMLQWGLYAAGLRLPFLPTRAGLGSDVLRVNPELRTVRSPYADGEELVAVPAIELDAALIHMNRADAAGNGQFLGPDLYFDDLFCGAAKRRFMSCEKIVPTKDLTSEGSLHGYGQAWALTHFLMNRHFNKLMQWYGLIAHRKQKGQLTGEQLLASFQHVFGDLNALDREWRAYMRTLKTDLQRVLDEEKQR